MMDMVQRIKALFKIARLISSDDSGNFQHGVFAYMGSTPEGQIFIPYGDLMRPPDGAQMAVFAQNGNESNAIAFASDPKNRTVKNLLPGEKGIANYVSGSYILIHNNGDVEVSSEADVTISKAATVTVNAAVGVAITAPLTTITGDVTINGDLVNNDITFHTHTHAQGSDSHGDSEVETDPPT